MDLFYHKWLRILFTLGIVILTLCLSTLVYCDMEVGKDEYETINDIYDTNNNTKSLIVTCLKDGKITNSEYHLILRRR